MYVYFMFCMSMSMSIEMHCTIAFNDKWCCCWWNKRKWYHSTNARDYLKIIQTWSWPENKQLCACKCFQTGLLTDVKCLAVCFAYHFFWFKNKSISLEFCFAAIFSVISFDFFLFQMMLVYWKSIFRSLSNTNSIWISQLPN